MSSLPQRKICPWCHRPLDPAAFTRNKAFADGIERICRECLNHRQRINRERQHASETPEQQATRRTAESARTRSYYTREKGRRGHEIRKARETPIERAIRLERMRAWRTERIDAERARTRAYQAEHRDELRTKQSAYGKANRAAATAQQRAWRHAHRANKRASEQKRRAAKLGNGGSFSPEQWQSLCEKYDHRCLACGEQKPLTVDHVVPLKLGGTNEISNIQPLCRNCNSAKQAHIIDYRT
jgi:5-methylcytosine-specific restriction endonuclease McrA